MSRTDSLEQLGREIATLTVELKNLREEVKELRETDKLLIQFMYKVQGGKALFFSMLTIAAAIGSVLTSLGHYALNR